MSLKPKIIVVQLSADLDRQFRQVEKFMVPFLGRVAMDPSTSNLGPEDEGLCWYNTGLHKYRYWDGTAIQDGMG